MLETHNPAWKSKLYDTVGNLRDHPPTEREKPGFIGEVFVRVRIPLIQIVPYGAVRFLYESGFLVQIFPNGWKELWEAVHE